MVFLKWALWVDGVVRDLLHLGRARIPGIWVAHQGAVLGVREWEWEWDRGRGREWEWEWAWVWAWVWVWV